MIMFLLQIEGSCDNTIRLSLITLEPHIKDYFKDNELYVITSLINLISKIFPYYYSLSSFLPAFTRIVYTNFLYSNLLKCTIFKINKINRYYFIFII